MKPWELLGQTRAPDGADLSLTLRSGEYVILANGKSLMSSRMHGSEEALATFACARIRGREEPRVLVGGLGMGFTLRATLDHLPPDATVVVAELLPAVVEWNRGPLGPLAGHPLKDRRVQVEPGDVAITLRSSVKCVRRHPARRRQRARCLRHVRQRRALRRRGTGGGADALRDGGVLAVWSAREDRRFEQRLKYAGFRVEVERVRARLKKGGPRHTIFLGITAG